MRKIERERYVVYMHTYIDLYIQREIEREGASKRGTERMRENTVDIEKNQEKEKSGVR